MNDRIKELKRQATIKIQSHGAFGEPESRQQLDVDKFAELIIEECLSNIQNCDGDIDYAIYKIKKDFGVE